MVRRRPLTNGHHDCVSTTTEPHTANIKPQETNWSNIANNMQTKYIGTLWYTHPIPASLFYNLSIFLTLKLWKESETWWTRRCGSFSDSLTGNYMQLLYWAAAVADSKTRCFNMSSSSVANTKPFFVWWLMYHSFLVSHWCFYLLAFPQ